MSSKSKKKVQKKAAVKKPAAKKAPVKAKVMKACKVAVKKVVAQPARPARFVKVIPTAASYPRDIAKIAALERKVETLQAANDHAAEVIQNIASVVRGPDGVNPVNTSLWMEVADKVSLAAQMGKLAEDLDSVLRPLEGEGLLDAAKRLIKSVVEGKNVVVVDDLSKLSRGLATEVETSKKKSKEKETGMKVPKDIAEIAEIVGEAEVWRAAREVLGLDQPEIEEVIEEAETEAEVVVVQAKTAAPKPAGTGRRGRPKGSKNKPKLIEPAASPDIEAIHQAELGATTYEEEGVEIG